MEPKNQEDLQRWLDRALVDYGNMEPRSGLEARVLANLSAERERIAARQRWFWARALTATAVVIILAVWMDDNTTQPTKTPISVTEASDQQAESRQRPIETAKPDVFQQSRKITSPGASRHRAAHSFENRASQKLDHFPSSQPLSAQEKLLLAYLNQTPKEEVMLLAIVKAKSTEDLQVKNLEIQSLGNATSASESSERK